jgi:hypothetical protein
MHTWPRIPKHLGHSAGGRGWFGVLTRRGAEPFRRQPIKDKKMLTTIIVIALTLIALAAIAARARSGLRARAAAELGRR